MAMNDPELIEKILKGNTAYYEYIVEKYQQGVFRICLGFVHQKEDADDITQEVFVKVFLSLSSFKGKSEFSTWLYRIAINASLNFKRQSIRKVQLVKEVVFEDNEDNQSFFVEQSPSADEILIGKEDAEQVHKAINALPEKQRIAFILSKYDELPQKKVAEIMNTSEGGVEQLLQRAKCKLREKLTLFYDTNYCGS